VVTARACPCLIVAFSVAIGVGCGDENQLGRIRATKTGDTSQGPPPRVPYEEALNEACGAAEPGRRNVLLRGPYLQRVTATSATIVWTARNGGEVEVVSPSSDLRVEVSAEADTSAPLPVGHQWVADVEGLEPGSIHCYSIRDGEGALVSHVGFRTAPDEDEPIRFVAFGDVGARTGDQRAVYDQIRTVASDFVVVTGDVAYEEGKLSELEDNFFGVYRELLRHVPVFPASGNHDYETDDAAPFRQAFVLPENGGGGGVERWYAFDWGPVHVVVLDTERLGDEQRDWLEADLAATTAIWKIAVLHRPPFSSGDHGSDMAVRALFAPVFERHGVQLVLAGHDHDYERTHELGGVTYVVTGAGGRGTRDVGTSDFTAFSEPVSHFSYVEATPDELVLRAIDGTGAHFDGVRLE
jgi:hypothetical protein